ncbi:MAG: DUF4215 domain-containing protein, partial [Myxococcales bacterium]|nr:DUF4215 domain-containing protein [Myxococcales bacterium]
MPASAFADCGDGLLEMNEECDDANDVSGDGCSEFCFIESRNVCEPAGFQLDVKEDWGGALNWVLTMDNRGITQAANSDPGVYSTTMEADIAIVEFEMAVETTDDDDFIGWTVGFDSGESTSATADWLLFDWKQANQTAFSANATRGLAMSRVEGIANTTTLWGHTGAVTEIARANNYADTGWADNQVYRVRMEASATRIRVWVDLDPNDNIPGTLEFDETGTFPTGKFGFYTFSQPNDRFTLISPPGDSYCSTDQDDDDIKDRVDEDADNDGIPDSVESPGYPYGPGNDEDTDGVPDWNDPDHVVGGCVGDGGDPARCLTLPIALDFDADGVPNHLDLDSDGDGLTDAFESGGTDDDGDGIADDCLPVTVSGACQNPVPVPPNTDETDGPDYLDTDSDGDGLGDLLEAFDVDDNEMADDVTPVGND